MIVVTGGSGFIGTNLCKKLSSDGQDFSILDRIGSPAFPERRLDCDICNIDNLRKSLEGGPGDTIVHLAAEHRDDIRPRSRYHDVNVLGTENVAQLARERGIERIVFTSTVAVYGFAAPETGENGAINPFNDYGETKHQAELILRHWQQEDPVKRSLVIVRPTVVFGPGNRGNVFNLLSLIKSGKFVMIGKGNNRKSMAFVGNVAAFLCYATRFGAGIYIYNYVDKPDLTMNELVATVRECLLHKRGVGPRLPLWLGRMAGKLSDVSAGLTGRSLPISSIRIEKFCASTSFASSAHEVDGFAAELSLQEALKLTLEKEFLCPDPSAPIFFTE